MHSSEIYSRFFPKWHYEYNFHKFDYLYKQINRTLRQSFTFAQTERVVVCLLALTEQPVAIQTRIAYINKTNPQLIDELKALKFEHDLLD